MCHVTIEEAQTQFLRLVQAARNGEEIIVTQGDVPIAKLVALPTPKPRAQFGSAKGMISMSDDFDAPLEDFKEYMG